MDYCERHFTGISERVRRFYEELSGVGKCPDRHFPRRAGYRGLSTPKGTVPGYREFGIDISDILDRPENVAQPMLCAAIKEAIERFEPRATYMGTTFKSSKDNPGTMLPVVEVSINA